MIAGKPMIQYVYEQAAKAKCAGTVIVATDDERIRRAVEAFGGKAVMTSADCASGTDRVAEAARGLQAEIVVNVQGDEPLLVPEMVDQAVAPLLEDPALEMATLATPIQDEKEKLDPAVVKVVVDQQGYALYFSRAAIPHVRESREEASPASRHLGLYAFRRDFLLRFAELPQTPLELTEKLEQLRALEHGHRIRVVITEGRSLGVDTPEDLERVRELLEPRTKANGPGERLPGPWRVGFAVGLHTEPRDGELAHTALGERLARFKYGDHREEADPIAKQLVDFAREVPDYQGIELILHVPSEGRRRGWEPARELATRFARALRVRCHPGLIAKSRATQPQKDLVQLEEKRRNVAGAFRLRRPEFVKDKRILLLDDLYDSGATLEEIYRLLIAAGAREVTLLTVTRTSHTHH